MRLPFSRIFGPSASVILLIAGVIFWATGAPIPGIQQPLSSNTEDAKAPAATSNSSYSAGVSKPQNRIRIATFNLQAFGPSKASNSDLLAVLGHIIRHFDIVAIQEIRSKDPQPVLDLLAAVNSQAPLYSYVISERLGRTVMQEQYAFFYDSDRVELIAGSDFVVNDPSDRIHREPHVASFRTTPRVAGDAPPFTFTLINIHTDPDEATEEMEAMHDVFQGVRQYVYPEDDLIVLGDMNAETDELGRLVQIPYVATLAGPEPTNTAMTRQIDHIVADRRATREFTGTAGVINFMRDLGFDSQMARRLSDHMPVWAEFTAVEERVGPAVATRPGQVR